MAGTFLALRPHASESIPTTASTFPKPSVARRESLRPRPDPLARPTATPELQSPLPTAYGVHFQLAEGGRVFHRRRRGSRRRPRSALANAFTRKEKCALNGTRCIGFVGWDRVGTALAGRALHRARRGRVLRPAERLAGWRDIVAMTRGKDLARLASDGAASRCPNRERSLRHVF